MEALLHDEYVQGRQVYDGSPGLRVLLDPEQATVEAWSLRSPFYSSLVENI